MMASARKILGFFGVAIVAATISAGSAWAGGADGVVDMSRAVGSGVLNGGLVGFTVTGPTNEAASVAAVAACQQAGAQDCTRDEVTNDNLCVVSVGADDNTGVVAGGSGPTLEAARDDALRHAQDANAALGPGARILASACP
jgi:hypothetical protein